jgi:hypothetical protein
MLVGRLKQIGLFVSTSAYISKRFLIMTLSIVLFYANLLNYLADLSLLLDPIEKRFEFEERASETYTIERARQVSEK